MAVTERNFEQFESRVVGRRVNEQTYNKYEKWARRFEMWRSGDVPTLGDLIDFDSLLADEGLTDYPWENNVGRPAPDSYAYRSRLVALSAIKLWSRVQYDVDISEEVQNIVSGEPEEFDPPYVSTNDIESVISDAPDACNCSGCQAALAVTYDAVLRASELVILSVDDFDPESETLYVHATKGSASGQIQLASRTASLLRQHISENEPRTKLFTNTYDNGWRASSWSSHVRNRHHEVGAHSLGRHSPIVHMLQHPEEFEYIDETQDVFGQVYQRARHRHPSTTSRYAKVVGMDVPDWGGG